MTSSCIGAKLIPVTLRMSHTGWRASRGKFWCVKTRSTPGESSAARTSMLAIRPHAMVLVTKTAQASPPGSMSAL